MKKFCSILLALALVLSLAACGGNNGGSGDTGSGSSTSGDSGSGDSGSGSGSTGGFKIGGTGPLTGDASIYGIAVRREQSCAG